jgi:D-3-phosphoglycerate dehydrogenase / 2-oxoglutarate reductase
VGERSTFTVLVAEKISPDGIEKLKKNFRVDAFDRIERAELLQTVARYDAMVVRSGTVVDEEVIARAENMKIIGRAGIGIDNIDVEAATRRGIMVANVPESNIISAAEHTMAMLLATARNIPAANTSVVSGEWRRSEYQGVELFGKNLGIIGLGRIGALVAERASAFGMNIMGFDPFISGQKAQHLGVEMTPDLDELLRHSDFVTLHVPRNEDTYHMISRGELSRVKDNLRIVNVSRGGVIDEEALAEAILEGRIAGAAIDVFESEPPTGSPLVDLPQVVVTPHLGASTSEAQYKAGVAIADQVISGLTGGFVSGAVNIAMPHKEVVETLRPYLPLCEKLGRLMTHLMHGSVSEMELEILGAVSEYDTSLLTVAFLKGFLGNISTEPVTYVNAPILAIERGITMKESKSRQSRDYVNMINVSAAGESETVAAGATLVGKNQEMFVGVLEFDIVIPPSRYMALVRYEDKPGMIGRIGTILGSRNINIAVLQVGRERLEGEAAMGLTLDSPISQEVLQEIKEEPGVKQAMFIYL